MSQIYGELDPLYAAVRDYAPDVAAACCGGMEHGTGAERLFMRVTYRQKGPRHVVWDDALEVYRWDNGPDAGTQLGRDAARAAEGIARALAAPVIPDRE